MKVWLFSTLVDCHLLSACCLLVIYLYKMGNLSFTFTPSMSGLSMTFNDEEKDSSGPTKHAKKRIATIKTTHATFLWAPLTLWEAMSLPWYSWSEMPQYLPAPECRNSLALWYDPQLPPPTPASRLKDRWKPSSSTRNKMLLTSLRSQLKNKAWIHLILSQSSLNG